MDLKVGQVITAKITTRYATKGQQFTIEYIDPREIVLVDELDNATMYHPKELMYYFEGV